jgi:hypothetical protein
MKKLNANIDFLLIGIGRAVHQPITSKMELMPFNIGQDEALAVGAQHFNFWLCNRRDDGDSRLLIMEYEQGMRMRQNIRQVGSGKSKFPSHQKNYLS